MQARFLIPMALSLAFGILFATFVILLVVPATYMIVEDLKKLVARALGLLMGEREPSNKAVEIGSDHVGFSSILDE